MAMAFRLLRGYHRDWAHEINRDTRQKVTTKRRYKPGETVESERDLVKLFNHPGSVKFERLPDPPQPDAPGYRPITVVQKPDVDLDALTIRDLQSMAEQEEIDLGGAKTKEQMVKAVRQALG